MGWTFLRRKKQEDSHDSNEEDKYKDLVFIFISSAILLLIGIYACYRFLNNPTYFGQLLLWSMALLVAGGSVGFLFGIPKVIQGIRQPMPSAQGPSSNSNSVIPEPTRESPYEQRVNTNLEEISDWLTKIVVGLGLVNFKSIPGHVYALARRIADSITITRDPGDLDRNASFSLALVLFFSIAGFLIGYLLTRLYIQGALARAERRIPEENQRLRLRLTSVETARQVLQETIQVKGQVTASASSVQIDDELRALSRQYMAISIPDYTQRLAVKNNIASKMYRHVLDRGISRDDLADQDDEGLIMALATAVHASPLKDDFTRLMKVYSKAKRLHIKYRITIAIEELFRQKICGPAEKTQAIDALKTYLVGADQSLEHAIQTAMKTIQSI